MTTYPSFPELSRAFALKQDEVPIDPTLRDTYENGMESARARFRRVRRTFSMSLDHLTADDKAALDTFYQDMSAGSGFGTLPFAVLDPRNLENPQTYTVRFLTLPKYTDDGWIGPDTLGNGGQFRYNCMFQVREV